MPTEEKVAAALKATANGKSMGPCGLPVGVLKPELKTGSQCFPRAPPIGQVTLIWREARGVQQGKDAIITVLSDKNDNTECGNYRGNLPNLLLRVIARRLGGHCDARGLSPKEEPVLGPDRPHYDMVPLREWFGPVTMESGVMDFMCSIFFVSIFLHSCKKSIPKCG